MIPRKTYVVFLLIGLGGFTGTGVAQAEEHPAAAGSPKRPSVVLCMADDQGWGEVGYQLGGAGVQTPTLDSMADHGLRLDRFYAAAPVCSPTRGSVLTGRHPNRFGCFQWGYSLRPEEVTLAELLQQAGYATGHFGKWHLGPVQTGQPNSPGASGFDVWLSSPNFYENNPLLSREGTVVETRGESSMVVAEAALDFIAQTTREAPDQPFLAVVWFGSPHLPHQATPETRAPYVDLPERVQHYYGEITGIDQAMKRLRDGLRTLGVAENTVLWYTSDNGPRPPEEADLSASTGGLRGLKGTLWEGGIRVPAILEWPAGMAESRVVDVPCGTVDIFPTVLDLAGVTIPEAAARPLDGVSLRPLIEGTMTERPAPLGFWNYPIPGRRTPSAEILETMRQEAQGGPAVADEAENPVPSEADTLPGHAAWIDGPFKLHRLPPRHEEGPPRFQLYDLHADPAEATDLAAQQPERIEAMKAALDAWQRSVVRSLKGEDE